MKLCTLELTNEQIDNALKLLYNLESHVTLVDGKPTWMPNLALKLAAVDAISKIYITLRPLHAAFRASMDKLVRAGRTKEIAELAQLKNKIKMPVIQFEDLDWDNPLNHYSSEAVRNLKEMGIVVD